MPPSADAFPGRAERVEPEPTSPPAGVPPPRSAPEVESTRVASPPTDRPRATEPSEAVELPPGPSRSVELPPGEPTDPAAADPAVGSGAGDELAERDRRILAFERNWWRHAGAKEQAIRDTFGLSATRYYQLLNALLDNPAALAADPVLVSRLRRLRSSRARNRRR
ncbi:DUF3263 domain-containing protein [Micromonospora sp. WMMD882]|uniref:DUF3263 domain-containing protein n=1 Tax=Micromonospora sp. WMMD882 TaxID=3015151 RepID=UPI00248CCB3F|nr:DUF3263 domain-containing protein [Micromonospora sp. WMMD882]WBB78940.1 DUF3263 domain-containing protein [Micromonospora sp. WMMD882]